MTLAGKKANSLPACPPILGVLTDFPQIHQFPKSLPAAQAPLTSAIRGRHRRLRSGERGRRLCPRAWPREDYDEEKEVHARLPGTGPRLARGSRGG